MPPFYDSLLAKLVVWDSTATRRSPARSARSQETVIEGVPTTRDFALGVIRSDEFAKRHLLDLDPRRADAGRMTLSTRGPARHDHRSPTRCCSRSRRARRRASDGVSVRRRRSVDVDGAGRPARALCRARGAADGAGRAGPGSRRSGAEQTCALEVTVEVAFEELR